MRNHWQEKYTFVLSFQVFNCKPFSLSHLVQFWYLQMCRTILYSDIHDIVISADEGTRQNQMMIKHVGDTESWTYFNRANILRLISMIHNLFLINEVEFVNFLELVQFISNFFSLKNNFSSFLLCCLGHNCQTKITLSFFSEISKLSKGCYFQRLFEDLNFQRLFEDLNFQGLFEDLNFLRAASLMINLICSPFNSLLINYFFGGRD